jgi:hypothetical protein
MYIWVIFADVLTTECYIMLKIFIPNPSGFVINAKQSVKLKIKDVSKNFLIFGYF